MSGIGAIQGCPTLNLIYSALLVTSYCAVRRKDGLCVLVRGFSVSRKGGTGGRGWSHPQGDMHMVAARLGCQSAMVVGQFMPQLHGRA